MLSTSIMKPFESFFTVAAYAVALLVISSPTGSAFAAAVEATQPPAQAESTLRIVKELAGQPSTAPADPANLDEKYAVVLDYLLPRIDGSGSKQHDEAVKLLRAISFHAVRPDATERRHACLAALCDALATDLSQAASTEVLRVLALTGGDRAVAAIAPYLQDARPRIREEARAALTTMGSEAAAQVIAEALSDQTDPGFLAGLIHSLGEIGRPQDREHILPYLSSADNLLKESAVKALVALGSSAALDALTPLLLADRDGEQVADVLIATQLLQLADNARAQGEIATALQTYERLLVAEMPETVRGGAITGWAACSPENAIAILQTYLAGEDPMMQEAAIRATAELGADSGVIELLRAFATATANPIATTAILRELESRNAREALAEIREMASQGGPAIAPEAIAILGRIGEADDLNLLLSLAATGAEPMRSTARQAIKRFRGDQQIESTLQDLIGDDAVSATLRAEAIRAASSRSHLVLLQTILPLLSSADQAIAAAAYEATSQLARPEDIPALVSGLQEPGAPAFPRLRVILQKLCKETTLPDEATTAIITATSDAGSETISAGLSLLAVLGTDPGLSHLQGCLQSEAPELKTAAVRALSEWSSFASAELLTAMLKDPAYGETEKSQVINGIARLARAEEIAPFEDRLRLALDALPFATSANDARKLLSSLGTLPSVQTAEALEGLLQREDIAKEAAAAAIQVAANLPEDDTAKARRAALLAKVLEVPDLPESLKEKARAAQGTP